MVIVPLELWPRLHGIVQMKSLALYLTQGKQGSIYVNYYDY